MTDNCLNCKHIMVTSYNETNPAGVCHRFPQAVHRNAKAIKNGCGEWQKGTENKLIPEKEVKKPVLRNTTLINNVAANEGEQ